MEIYITGFVVMFILTLHRLTDIRTEEIEFIDGNILPMDWVFTIITCLLISLFWGLFLFLEIREIIGHVKTRRKHEY